VNEIGSILPGDHKSDNIDSTYWNLSGATYAYVFGQLASLGIDLVGESQLVGYPTQFPSVSMVDWTTGAPNARWRVLELLKANFAPGDRIVKASSGSPYVYAFGVVKPGGEHKLLLVNKRDREFTLTLPGVAAEVRTVDQTTQGGEAARQELTGSTVTLRGLAVAVVTMAAQ
jgi:hypothetical protein